MKGFCIRFGLDGSDAAPSALPGEPAPAPLALDDGSRLWFDGYLLNADVRELAGELGRGNARFLNGLDGHFSGVLRTPGGELVGFCDRFGGKSLYWQALPGSRLAVASRAHLMPHHDVRIDPVSQSEALRYRCLSGSRTLLRDVRQLPPHHTVALGSADAAPVSYWRLPPPAYNDEPFEGKVAATRAALLASLRRARKRHRKAAVFLSGGVDSSLLAALCKEVFDECLLITPDFQDWYNPEMERAVHFAGRLGLEHRVVQVDPARLEADLRLLIDLKRQPVRHYSSLAMMAVMRSLPEDAGLAVYGCTADILFGMIGIKQLTSFPFDRGRLEFLMTDFANISYRYSPAGRSLVEGMTDGEAIRHEGWEWARDIRHARPSDVRYMAQEAVISLDVGAHFKETGMIAELFGKQITAPYFAPEVQAVSATLSHTDALGGEYVKPVLRELACEHYDRDMIYCRKLAFPVPLISWLQGPLSPLVAELREEREMFDGRALHDIRVDEDPSVFWALMNWRLAREHLERTVSAPC